MAEHEFERFLEVLSKLLKLSSRETAAVADEICDHLEERYSELVHLGISRDDAVKQALDEFDDAGEFASKLNQLVRQRTRRRIMTGALTTAAASALAILVTTAFWPDQRQPVGVIAQSSARDQADPQAASGEVVYIDEGRFLPEWMRKEVAEDLKPQTLQEFKQFLEEFTGRVVRLDHTELNNSGIGADVKIPATPAGGPLYLVLNRALADVGGTELGWIVDRGILKISSSEKIGWIKSALTVDVSPVLAQGLEMDRVVELLHGQTTGPWQAIDGDGGSITPLGQRVTITSNQQNHLEAQSVLAALATKAPIISLSEPYSMKAIQEALRKNVNCRFEDIPLEQAIAELSRQAGLRFDFDEAELANSGVGLDVRVTLSVSDVTLEVALDLLLEDVGGVELTTVPMNGLLAVTSRERADEIQRVQLLDVSDLISAEDVPQLISLIHNATSGPWQEIDGDGGTIAQLPGPRIIVRQTRKGLDELHELLNDHRVAAKSAISLPAVDQNAIETRYYRMTEAQANDLKAIIPRYVAVDSWVPLPDGSPPAIDKVTVSGQGGLGGIGGGFFQIGGLPEQAPMKPGIGGGGETDKLLKELLDGLRQRQEPATPGTAVLVIRQTRRVHREIEKFLRDLSAKSGARFFDPVPNAGGFGGGGLGGGGLGGGGFGGGGLGGGGFF